MLSIQNLTKQFGSFHAVRNCSFDIEEGSITGLIGPNGAGKSTTFNMIAGELAPTSGSIVFQGEDIAGLATYQMFHRGIVRTFQIPQEFKRMTVLENLMVVPGGQLGESIIKNFVARSSVAARETAVKQKAEDTLKFLAIWHLRDELAGNLSGGRRSSWNSAEP